MNEWKKKEKSFTWICLWHWDIEFKKKSVRTHTHTPTNEMFNVWLFGLKKNQRWWWWWCRAHKNFRIYYLVSNTSELFTEHQHFYSFIVFLFQPFLRANSCSRCFVYLCQVYILQYCYHHHYIYGAGKQIMNQFNESVVMWVQKNMQFSWIVELWLAAQNLISIPQTSFHLEFHYLFFLISKEIYNEIVKNNNIHNYSILNQWPFQIPKS